MGRESRLIGNFSIFNRLTVLTLQRSIRVSEPTNPNKMSLPNYSHELDRGVIIFREHPTIRTGESRIKVVRGKLK